MIDSRKIKDSFILQSYFVRVKSKWSHIGLVAFHIFADMRKALSVFIISVFIVSCSTDFSVTTSWKDIGIIYGLLDQSDTAQYIKIMKAYLDPNTSALTIAQNPDSIYYPDDITVDLLQLQGSTVIQTIPLKRVDANLEGYQKDTGTFANSPNYAYKTISPLNQAYSYEVQVTRPENAQVISSETNLVSSFSVNAPSTSSIISLLPAANSFYHVKWTSAKNGKVYALTIRFHYVEMQASDTNQKVNKYVDWVIFTSKLAQQTNGGESLDEQVVGQQFYTTLAEFIPVDNNVVRRPGRLDFLFSVGGLELYNYNEVLLAQQGLTLGQVEPQYTNVNNGLGLLSSRFHQSVSNLPLSQNTVDSLACNIVTSPLHFLNSRNEVCH